MARLQTEVKKWFPVPDDPDGGEVHIRHLRSGEIESIMDRTRELVFRDGENVVRMNGTYEAAIVAAIDGWKNFFDQDGNELKCTPGNIRRKCRDDGFMSFIDEIRKELAAEVKKSEKAELKN